MAALSFLFEFAGKVLVGIFLLRFFLQATRSDFRNPISAAVVQLTNPVVMPLRKLIPGWGGMDNASLFAALVLQAIVLLAGAMLFRGSLAGLNLVNLLVSTAFSLVLAIIGLYLVLVFFSVILSWINQDPYNPLANVVGSLTEPVMRPARRLVPPIGGFDISPVIVLIALQAIKIFFETTVASRLF